MRRSSIAMAKQLGAKAWFSSKRKINIGIWMHPWVVIDSANAGNVIYSREYIYYPALLIAVLHRIYFINIEY